MDNNAIIKNSSSNQKFSTINFVVKLLVQLKDRGKWYRAKVCVLCR
jgi:hypothetical protein